ncbi:MAG: hypothetical protein JXR77_12085, partial [Lentisphaeria bacterium]|nr:hypothetical protein [Lentisphaeria bacterium]
VDPQGHSFGHALAWIVLPETVPVDARWDASRYDTVSIRCAADYPDPRFAAATARIGDTSLPLETDENAENRLLRLPREEQTLPPRLALTVDPGTGPVAFPLDTAARPRNAPPVLLAFEDWGSFLQPFEAPDPAPLQFSADGRMGVLHDDPRQGRFLEVRNTALEQRLSSSFTTAFSIAQFPILQFRYRAYDMAHLTLAFANSHYVRLNDDYAPAAAVRLAHDLRLDDTWHTWTGFVADAFTQEPFATTRFQPKSFTLASAGSPDQTGRYSRWHLDDLVCGPAVAKAEDLRCVPRYYDRDGVRSLAAAVLAGATAYDELGPEQQAALTWVPCEPGKALPVALDGLADGVHHLLCKATDARGAESVVTDIPFLLDTKPLEVSAAVGPGAEPASNGLQLTVAMANHGGAPWRIEKARFLVAGKEQEISPWLTRFVHGTESEQLILNYPFLFRSHLDRAKDGDVLEFALDDIVDGAGNPTPRLSVPLKVDYATDKTGPAWYYISFDTSVHWWWNWDGYRNTTVAFSPGQHNQATVAHTAGSSPFLTHLTYSSSGDLTRSLSWRPSSHPWLAFRAMQPAYNPKRGILCRLVLTTTDGRTYTLSLTAPAKGDAELNRSQTVPWQKDIWTRLAFNVRDLLKAAGVSDELLEKTVINSVNIQRRGTQNQEPLYLDDFFIHGGPADPAKPDPLKWYAYDASGVDNLQVECLDAEDKTLWAETLPAPSADLQPLRARITGHAWLRCSARDKAGNLSVPFWLPLGGS